jgi:hypothetical protein
MGFGIRGRVACRGQGWKRRTIDVAQLFVVFAI